MPYLILEWMNVVHEHMNIKDINLSRVSLHKLSLFRTFSYAKNMQKGFDEVFDNSVISKQQTINNYLRIFKTYLDHPRLNHRIPVQAHLPSHSRDSRGSSIIH